MFRDVLLAKGKFLNLARRRSRKLVQEEPLPRRFLWRETFADESVKFLFERFGRSFQLSPWRQTDKGNHLLATFVVGHTHHRHISHGSMRK